MIAMEKETIQRCLGKAAEKLAFALEGSTAFGWHFKSAGSKVRDSHGEIFWLRVLAWPKDQKNDLLWHGLKTAGQIKGVGKPEWLVENEWEEAALRVRADVLEFIDDKPISQTNDLKVEIALSPEWMGDLRQSLEALHAVVTDRICVRQDLVSRRLRERFGENVDTEIRAWETSHGDLHWGNLTMPNCWLLDWEAWGIAPKGFDVALLYCFALQQPKIAEFVHQSFRDWMDTSDGRKAQMFACAELLRMAEHYADHPDLYPYLLKLAEKLGKEVGLNVLHPQ